MARFTVSLILVSSLFLFALASFFRATSFRVIFFDVGQGNSFLIETPKRSQILIDGGGDSRILSLLGQNLPFYDRHLDILILTHPDRDHLFGLLKVLERYRVDKVFLPPFLEETVLLGLFQERLKVSGAQVLEASEQSDFQSDGVSFDFLTPQAKLAALPLAENDQGITLAVSYQGLDLLAMGDASSRLEALLLSEWPDVEILQVGHHGSATSTSRLFLEKTTPILAVISVGKNSYGHPRQEVLERLEESKAKILRTDQVGSISVFLRDNQISIRTQKL